MVSANNYAICFIPLNRKYQLLQYVNAEKKTLSLLENNLAFF